MSKKLYLFVANAIIFLMVAVVAALFVVSSEKTSRYLGDKLLKQSGISYKKMKGSIIKGFKLEDVNLTDAISIKSLEVSYDAAMLFTTTPTIKKIKTTNLKIDINKLLSSDESVEKLNISSFALTNLILNNTQIIVGDERIIVDLDASGIKYTDKLSAKKVALLLNSPYGIMKIKGAIESNRLKAEASATPKDILYEKYIGFLTDVPKELELKLDASLHEITIKSGLEHIGFLSDEKLNIESSDITLKYFIDDKYFTLDATYLLNYDKYQSLINQSATFTSSGAYDSTIKGSVTKDPSEFLFKTFNAQISGDTHYMTADFNTPKADFDLLWHGSNEFHIKGIYENEYLNAKIDADYKIDEGELLLFSTVYPKYEADILEWYPLKIFPELEVTFYNKDKESILNIDSNILNIALFEKNSVIKGWGNFASVMLTAKGDISDDNNKNISLSANVASLNTLFSELSIDIADTNSYYDAEVNINSKFTFGEKTEIKSRIDIPWYVLKTDTQKIYQGENLFADITTAGKSITVDKYNIDFMNHRIYSKKHSKISFDENGTIFFDKFWIYENLLLSGSVKDMKGSFKLYGNNFHYKGHDADLRANVDIRAEFDKNSTQNIEGSITLLDGVVTYEPSTDYTISDEDIIIIQDIKAQSKIKRNMNVHINSVKPIGYKTENIEAKFSPDFAVIQKPNDRVRIYGMATINEGELHGGGKSFELSESQVYFYGAYPHNPYLNIHVKHHVEADNIDIDIFITNTLNSPVMILSSTPSMSQNDIMSYLLFGEAANSVFEGSTGGTSKASLGMVFFGTGLKTIFNDTTGINIDKLNILTNEEGTFGYEIGARFSKQARIIYSNENIQSITLQYSLSKSIRIDVNVHEAGEGVSVLYVKDFNDFDFMKKK